MNCLLLNNFVNRKGIAKTYNGRVVRGARLREMKGRFKLRSDYSGGYIGARFSLHTEKCP